MPLQRCRQNVANIWRTCQGLSKLSIKDKVKHLWVDLRDTDTVSKQYLKEFLTKCLVCTRWVGRYRGKLCIWWDWGSLPLCWQTTGSSGRSSCPVERSWCLRRCPAGHTIASGEFADTEKTHKKTWLKGRYPIQKTKIEQSPSLWQTLKQDIDTGFVSCSLTFTLLAAENRQAKSISRYNCDT